MNTRNSGMYTIKDECFNILWTAFVITTIIGDGDREHGWCGEGNTELEAIQDLEDQMEAVK